MQKLIDRLKNDDSFRLGGRGDINTIISCKKNLEYSGFASFPNDLTLLLKQINGISNDTSRIFGIKPDKSAGHLDIFEENTLLNRDDKSIILIIGYNIFDWLAYDVKKEEYIAYDKNDNKIMQQFKRIESALAYLLNV